MIMRTRIKTYIRQRSTNPISNIFDSRTSTRKKSVITTRELMSINTNHCNQHRLPCRLEF